MQKKVVYSLGINENWKSSISIEKIQGGILEKCARSTAAALVGPLAQALPYATGAALKRKN